MYCVFTCYVTRSYGNSNTLIICNCDCRHVTISDTEISYNGDVVTELELSLVYDVVDRSRDGYASMYMYGRMAMALR